jgi:hypothetical protein
MRWLVLIPLLLLPGASSSQPGLIRDLFFAAKDENTIVRFHQVCSKSVSDDPINLAYLGTASAMMAEVVSGVRQKLDWFERGKGNIEKAITLDPGNPEIAFLRFSVQSEAPRFLGYHNELHKDADTILGSLRAGRIEASEPYWQNVVLFMQQSGQLNKLQQAELRKYLSENEK